MLPRPYRIQDHHAFPQIYSQGKRRSGSVLGLTYLPRFRGGEGTASPSDLPSQFAVVVSKKVSKKATDRNRIKRRVYGILYPLLPQICSGYWIVFAARARCLDCSGQELDQEVVSLLQRAHLLPEVTTQTPLKPREVEKPVR